MLDTPLTPLFKLLAYMLPYALIPLTFKLAGGIFATLTGMVGDKTKGLSDRAKAGRARKTERFGRQVIAKRAGAARFLQDKGSSGSWVRRKALRGVARGVGGYNIEAAMSARQAAVAKEVGDQIATGRDDEVRGLTVEKRFLGAGGFELARNRGLARMHEGRRQYKTLGGGWVDEAAAVAGHKRWGNDRFAQQAALSYEQRKAMESGEGEQVEDVSRRYRDVAEGWGMSRTERKGAWIGASFENQNQHLEYKHTDGETGQLNYDSLVSETYEKKGSYPLAQGSAHTIHQLAAAYEAPVEAYKPVAATATSPGMTAAQVRDKNRARIKEIAETFEFRSQQGEVDGAPVLGQPARAQGTAQVSAPGAAAVQKAVQNLHNLTHQRPEPPQTP